MTYDGVHLSLWIDGTLDASLEVRTVVSIKNYPILVGASLNDYTARNRFDGDVYYLALWNSTR